MTGVLDIIIPDIPDNIPRNSQQAHNYWLDNLTLLRELAIQNMDVINNTSTKHLNPIV